MITWTIEAMKAKATNNGNADVVSEAHWRATAIDGDLSDTVYGSVAIPFTGGLFTPYEDLTQEQVLKWVFEQIDKNDIEINLTRIIDAKKNPTESIKDVPWNQND